MLVNRTDQLISRLTNFESRQKSSNESKRFIERSEKLKKITKEIEQIVLIVELFRRQGFKVDIENLLVYAHSLFEKLKVKWEEDKHSIIEAHEFFNKVIFNKIEQEVQRKLEEQWQEFITKNRPSLNMGQLDSLVNIPDLKGVVIELKEHLENLNNLKNSFPNQDANFQYVISITDKMKELWSQLDSKNISEEMMHFVKKAGTIEGVNLEEVTPEIIIWLKENNLIHLCQVRFQK